MQLPHYNTVARDRIVLGCTKRQCSEADPLNNYTSLHCSTHGSAQWPQDTRRQTHTHTHTHARARARARRERERERERERLLWESAGAGPIAEYIATERQRGLLWDEQPVQQVLGDSEKEAWRRRTLTDRTALASQSLVQCTQRQTMAVGLSCSTTDPAPVYHHYNLVATSTDPPAPTPMPMRANRSHARKVKGHCGH